MADRRLILLFLSLLAAPAAAQQDTADPVEGAPAAPPADAAVEGAEAAAPDGPAEPASPPLVPSTTPEILDAPVPAYPQEALDAGVEGSVVFVLQLDPDGIVLDAEVLRDPGTGLAEAALASVQDTVFDAPPHAGPAHELRRYFHVVRFVLPDEYRNLDPDEEPPEVADELTVLPQLIESVPAQYPADAKAEGVMGRVLLELDVSDRGTLDAVRFVETDAPGWGFELEAMRAVWQFGFDPAYAGEAPVPVRITYTYEFTLEEVEVEVVAETPDEGDAIDRDGPVNYSGVVRERGTRKPLASVDVLIEGFEESTLTDDYGYFEFRGIPAGVHRVLIAAPGYEKFETEEDVLPGQATEVVYFVRESPLGVPETIIRVKREKKEVTRRTIEVKTIERIPGTFGDPIKVVQNLPGVARSPFDFGLLIVRGSGPEDSGAHIDGIRVPQLFHFGGFRSIITPILLDSIDFYPGGYGGQYGRLTGGILDVKTRNKFEDTIHGLVQADLLDASAAMTGPILKKGQRAPIGGFVVAARRSYLDIVIPLLAPSQVDLAQFVFPQWTDVQGKVSLDLNEAHSVSMLAYYSQDRVGARQEDPTSSSFADSQGDFQFRNDFWRATASWNARPGDRFANKFTFAVGQDNTRLAFGSLGTLETNAIQLFLRDVAAFKVDEHLTVELGTDIIASWFEFLLFFSSFDFSTQGDDPNAEVEPLLLDTEDFFIAPGVWAEAQVKLLDGRIQLTPALRYDLWTVPGDFDTHGLDPRFRYRFTVDPDKKVDIKGSVGLYDQPPQGFEILDLTGNPLLGNEISFQTTLGTELRFTDFLSLELEGFYKKLDRLVTFGGAGNGTDGAWENSGEGHIFGGELFLRWKEFKNFEGWVALTLQKSTRRDHPDDEYYAFDFDQPVILDIVGTYGLPYGFRIGLRWRYVSGNPETPVTGSIYDADSDSYISLSGIYNSGRLPDFHQLDVRIDKDFNFRRWKLSVYLDLLNAYNRKNAESRVYNFDYTEQSFLYSLPILPNLGFKAQF